MMLLVEGTVHTFKVRRPGCLLLYDELKQLFHILQNWRRHQVKGSVHMMSQDRSVTPASRRQA